MKLFDSSAFYGILFIHSFLVIGITTFTLNLLWRKKFKEYTETVVNNYRIGKNKLDKELEELKLELQTYKNKESDYYNV